MAKESRYNLPIDAIATIPPTDPLAFMAAKMGFKIGTNSSQKKVWQEQENWNWAFPLTFLDCEFKKYNHQLHVEGCEAIRPKYAVVRDIMTPEQCENMGIEYFNFDTIMRYAEEIEQYAENIIVVPKFDCVSDIPPQYILGRAMSQYGKFHLDMNLMQGRKVHLLGGSWKKIKAFLERYDNIVSFDCNSMWKVSTRGVFCWPDGKQQSLRDYQFKVTSPMYVSMMLSLNSIAFSLHEIFNTGLEKSKQRTNHKQPRLI